MIYLLQFGKFATAVRDGKKNMALILISNLSHRLKISDTMILGSILNPTVEHLEEMKKFVPDDDGLNVLLTINEKLF